MKISYNWLNDYIDLRDVSPEEAASLLTMKSAEVDKSGWVNRHLEEVVVAHVEKVEPHPDSDKLQLATVFDGKNEHKVVCGAPNVAQGQKVAYAGTGTVLPGNFEIKPIKIRGVESCGMICAEDELGLGDDHDGIMILDNFMVPGTPVCKLFGEKDFIFEIENKTINHRPDLWGHLGVAREFKAILNKQWKKDPKYVEIKPENKAEHFEIEILTNKCLHYLGLKIGNIKVEESPQWLKNRLQNIGLRPINNVVDISNYIMLETGHPLHAFDRTEISGAKITIRDAFDEEKFMTLDGIERVLNPEDAVIADENKSLAIAGVMGGLNSGVCETTTEIFLESALFSPSNIRKTANRLDLRTDSSSRFEKSLWVENCYLATSRFVELIKQIIPEAEVQSELAIADNSKEYGFDGVVEIATEKMRSVLGIKKDDLEDAKIIEILNNLDFSVSEKGGVLTVSVPVHRRSKDISIAEDIIEEIGRIYGYNNIKPVSPFFNMDRAPVNYEVLKKNKIRDLMVKSFSGNEVMNYAFIKMEDIERIPFDEERIIKTVDERESPFLRHSMAPGLLKNLFENLKNYKDFSLFEFGRVYFDNSERKRFAAIITGRNSEFVKTKEIVSAISKELKTPPFRFSRIKDDTMSGNKILHPGKSCVISAIKDDIGIIGELHPILLKQYGINVKAAYLEIDLELLFNLPEKAVKFTSLFKFPSTSFDVTVIVPDRTEVENLLKIIKRSVDNKLLVETVVVDRFKGEPIPEGFLSISFRVVLNGKERTLTAEEMKSSQQKLFDDFRKTGYKISGD
jgi:phenylalanyl-tRNA synthetase beta chain